MSILDTLQGVNKSELCIKAIVMAEILNLPEYWNDASLVCTEDGEDELSIYCDNMCLGLTRFNERKEHGNS